jgi:hypothetical protein
LLHAVPGNLYEILCSSNLANWSSLAAIVPTNASMPFLDTGAVTRSRFYRLHALSRSSVWLENRGLTNGAFSFIVRSPSNLPVSVQAGTSLINWFTLSTFTNFAGATPYTDTQSTNFPIRFYRAQLLTY